MKNPKTQTKRSVLNFSAQVLHVKTLVRGGVNITLALPDNEIAIVTDLLNCRQKKAFLKISAIPEMQGEENAKERKDGKNRISRRKRRYPYK